MKSFSLVFTFVIVIGIAFSSCGGNSSSSGAEEVTDEARPKKVTPVEFAATVTKLYTQALAEVVYLIKDNPAADEVQPKIAELKEKYVKELVELGKKREAMEDTERSRVDLNIRIGLQNVYSEQAYTAYSEAIFAYAKNREVYKLLTDFNIITQYSDFELLKKQEPNEAQRLGIE